MRERVEVANQGISTDLWSILACPYCQGVVEPKGASVHCRGCQRQMPMEQGIPSLLREEDARRLAGFSAQYREARLRDGWRPMTGEQLLALPFGHPPGFQALYWETRRRSFEALWRILQRQGPRPEDGPVVDLGAGFGWLAYRLAQAGYRVVAIEASTDEFFGLGAARAYLGAGISFLPVQGNLESPPLRSQSASLIVLSASLHYARDLDATLRRCALALKPGGRLAIVDSPVARQPRPGTGKGDRHLGVAELSAALRAAGLEAHWVRVGQGWRWWVYRAKVWIRGTERFGFPLLIADRPPEEQGD